MQKQEVGRETSSQRITSSLLSLKLRVYVGKWLEIGWQRQIPAPHRCLTFVTETLKTSQVRPCLIFILERAL